MTNVIQENLWKDYTFKSSIDEEEAISVYEAAFLEEYNE